EPPMTIARRSLILGAPALILAACASVPQPSEPPIGAITLDEVFVGRLRGRGLFRVDLTGDERRFSARLHGTLRGDRLTVVEDFTYDDGQADRLTWVFDRAGPGRWTGRREDTVGTAQVVEADGVIRLDYTADFRSTDAVTRLVFSDVLYRGANGRILNDAIVRRWGVPVA
ncbi:MAG: DUF3833 family protein, partial [Paracoccaceae bacterium]